MRSFATALALALSFMTFCGRAAASEEEAVKVVFNEYWKTFATADFNTAADNMYSEDLELTQKEILPIFLELSKKSEKEAQEMANAFFAGIAADKRTAMTPKEVYVGLNKFVSIAAPQVFEVLKQAKLEIVKVQVTGDEATIEYSMNFQGASEKETNRLIKKDNRWWLRTPEDPREAGKRMRAAFGL